MITRQSYQSQVTLLKSSSTAQTGSGLGRTCFSRPPDGEGIHGAQAPARGPEVGNVLEGVVFLPLFKTGRAKRELPLGSWGGDVLLFLRTARRFRGRALGAVGRDSSKQDLLCLPY
jgi:hypothetical protein